MLSFMLFKSGLNDISFKTVFQPFSALYRIKKLLVQVQARLIPFLDFCLEKWKRPEDVGDADRFRVMGRKQKRK